MEIPPGTLQIPEEMLCRLSLKQNDHETCAIPSDEQLELERGPRLLDSVENQGRERSQQNTIFVKTNNEMKDMHQCKCGLRQPRNGSIST